MKLLASDYDNTLFTSNTGIRLNINAIKKFRNSGNKFAIITGRTFMSIKKEIDYFNIPFDYLSCNDGSTIFDSNNTLLTVQYLDRFQIHDITYYLTGLKKSGFIKKIYFYNEYTNISQSDSRYNSNIVEIGAKLNMLKNISIHIEEMKQFFPTVEINKCENFLFIKKPKNKSMAVQEIAKIENIEHNNIFTIGDALNDLEMIRDYNGYNMLLSDPNLYKESNGTMFSVRQLIKKINK